MDKDTHNNSNVFCVIKWKCRCCVYAYYGVHKVFYLLCDYHGETYCYYPSLDSWKFLYCEWEHRHGITIASASAHNGERKNMNTELSVYVLSIVSQRSKQAVTGLLEWMNERAKWMNEKAAAHTHKKDIYTRALNKNIVL